MVGIVCVGQIELSPFVKKYITVLEKKGEEYHIIHWDRSGVARNDGENMYTYTETLDRYAPKFKKLMPFVRFSRFVKKVIRDNKYDKLVILTTQTALLMLGTLIKYKNRYFFDYRDTSYEYIKPYGYIVNKIADYSLGMCVSSPGFKKYIKSNKAPVVSHNFQDKSYITRKLKCDKKNEGRIVMGYIGVLREYEYLKKLIGIFGNDSRFEFRIHGGGDDVERLREFASSYDNVYVAGAYREEEKANILTSFDLICYNYPYSFVNYPALANKFYDGMIMKKPMFANIRTFSGQLIDKNGLGISLDENDEKIADKIYEYYIGFDTEEFESNCEKFLLSVMEDEKEYIKEIEKITV